MASSFEHINPSTNKPWSRAELWEELETVKAVLSSTDEENVSLRKHCSKLLSDREKVTEKLLTNQQILNDLKLRWQIHNEEASKAVVDVKNLGATTRRIVEPQLVQFASWCSNTSKVFKRV